jgi:hypothetical protein
MYIIFIGQVEIIINGFLIKKVFCGGEFVGRTALETDKPRYLMFVRIIEKKLIEICFSINRVLGMPI